MSGASSTRGRFRAFALLPVAVAMAAPLLVACSRDGEDAASKPGTVTFPEAASPFVAFDVWVRVGSQHDPAGKEGLAVLTAALLAAGSSQDDPYPSILEQLYPMAADYSAFVDKEMTTFRGVVHRDNLDGYYRLLRNAILRPAFAAEDFERVKRQQLDYVERGRRFQRDEELSKELLFAMAYRGTPYAHPEEGTVRSVRGLTLDDARDFYRRHYTRDSVVVGIGGGYPEGFPARARTDFDALPPGEVPAVPPPQPRRPAGIEVLIVEKDTDATAISLGFPIDVVRGDDDYWPLFLAASWLGEHRSSFGRLYQVLREQRGMNYGDYAYVEAFPLGFTTMDRPINVARRSQLFEVWIRPVSGTGGENGDDLHDRALFATRAALREVGRLADGGVPAEQVERTKTYLGNNAVTFGATLLRRLGFAIDDAFYGLPDPGFLRSVRERVGALDTEAVAGAVGRHLRSDGLYLVFVTRDAAALREKLLAGEPTPIRYAGEQPPEVLAEDNEIASSRLAVTADAIEIVDISGVFEGDGPAAAEATADESRGTSAGGS
ncbi:MAG TPA: pitrilysin family protein [Thermoanaerobaculia bacterium]|nr:pitrilysin family protein [Thermoanaerobaculia bacterium]